MMRLALAAVVCLAPFVARADSHQDTVSVWNGLNDRCQAAGESADGAICAARDRVTAILLQFGMCFGGGNQPTYLSKWHECPASAPDPAPSGLPVYDVDANCGAQQAGAYRNACSNGEQEAYDFLKLTWPQFDTMVIQSCVAAVARSGTWMKYKTLSDCLVEREEIYQEELETHTEHTFQR